MAGEPSRVLVTGSTGLVGAAVVERLLETGLEVVAAVRAEGGAVRHGVPTLDLGDLEGYHAGMDLAGVDAVVHLAAKVHEMHSAEEDIDAFLGANARATHMLARSAARCGVRRFVFLSTVKVNGEFTLSRRPFRADDPPRPRGPYAVSKAAAEELLMAEHAAGALEVVILRSPLVYGGGVGANFGRLIGLADRAVPLPTGLDVNRRSLIGVENLAEAVRVAITAAGAGGHIYLVRDGVDVSTSDLVRRLRRAKGRAVPAVPGSARTLAAAARAARQGPAARRLLGSLTIDDTPIRRDLGWRPVNTLDQGLEMAVGLPARPRRLLFFVTEDWYFWSHRRTIALAAQRHGWEVHIACHIDQHAERMRAEGFAVHPLDLDRGGRGVVSEGRVLRQLADVMGRVRPDVLHNVAMKPILYGSIVASASGTPVVVNALAGLGAAFTGPSTTALGWGLTTMMRQCLGGARQWLIAQNADDARFAISHGLVSADRLAIIPGSGVDLAEFGYRPRRTQGRVTATVVSRMLWDKGIAETVEAARILRKAGVPVDVQLVGDVDPHNPRSLTRQQLQAWHEEGIIGWLGRREDIPDVWRESDIAVLASYREGMPKSLLEAASVGRPMIACDVPGSRELVRPGHNGLLVPARDARALARAIAALASDEQTRLEMGDRARRDVEAKYTSDRIVAGHLQLYDLASGLSTGGVTRDMRP